jgi:hypothetical protein
MVHRPARKQPRPHAGTHHTQGCGHHGGEALSALPRRARWQLSGMQGATTGTLRTPKRHGAPVATLKPTGEAVGRGSPWEAGVLTGVRGGWGDSNSWRQLGDLQGLEENTRKASRGLN